MTKQPKRSSRNCMQRTTDRRFYHMTTKTEVPGTVNAAVLSERLRVAAIVESAEGKRNPAMANELALRTSMDVETAKRLLASAPASNPYIEYMNREGPVNISAATANFSAPDPKEARKKE